MLSWTRALMLSLSERSSKSRGKSLYKSLLQILSLNVSLVVCLSCSFGVP